jgi:hypothetical protein
LCYVVLIMDLKLSLFSCSFVYHIWMEFDTPCKIGSYIKGRHWRKMRDLVWMEVVWSIWLMRNITFF